LSPLPCGPGGKHGIACLQPNQGEERVIGTHPQAQGIGFMHMHFDRNLILKVYPEGLFMRKHDAV